MDIDYIEKIKQEVEENIRINKIDEFFNENICVKLHVFSHWS